MTSCAMSSVWHDLTNFKLGIRIWRTTTRVSRRRYDLQGQRSRLQGHVISLRSVGPMAHQSKTNSHIITSFKVNRSKVWVTGRLTQTHKMCRIFRAVRPKNFKVGVRMEDVDPHQRKRHDLQVQGHKVTWYV